MRKSIVMFWALVLIAIAGAIFHHKTTVLKLPLKPNQEQPVWTVEAKVNFKGSNNTQLFFFIPKITPGFGRLSEYFSSRDYGLAVVGQETKDDNRQAQWSKRRARGPQTLYYRVSVTERENGKSWTSKPAPPTKPEYEEPYGSAIEMLLDSVREESADIGTYTRELIVQLNSNKSDENIDLLRSRRQTNEQWITQIIDILKGARIPARVLWGLTLNDASNDAKLKPLIQVFNGDSWLTFDPKTGEQGIPNNFLSWYVGDKPLLSTIGLNKDNAEVTFSVTKSDLRLIDIARSNSANNDSVFIDFSLFALPVENQNVYRVLLMVPLGALIVVFLRTLVGISTFGTFMPVLIALAFRETQLLVGVILFTVIVFLGLSIRFYLERLRLLLVPRLSAILVIVVILMILISLITNRLELNRALSLSLFPMVILAMTIERMSIVWEESGAKDALIQATGSMIVACLGYLVMTNAQLSYIMFVFPELLLVILAICLIMGRYTGYRLTELRRFRYMTNNR